jgi:serine/threonine-protein kinase
LSNRWYDKDMATAAPFGSRSLAGTVLSRRWKLVQKLGEGGMGEVYAAEPVDGGARVAVKALRAEFLAEPHVISRFNEEARTCLRLIHPNIVRILDCGTAEDGSPYIAMELLDGVPLSAYTQNGGRVAVAQAVPILQGILAGLAAAHAQGIVHRDLKPDNVFLTRGAEGTFVVKVLDFGIAKVMDEAGGMGSRTRTGMLLGTPAYMSPEQVKDARDVDQRADLWSAGVMFYEMLTGRVAFPAPTAYARLAAVVTMDPEPVERIDPALAPLSAFVTRALRKNREERFGSALEMARALAAAAPGVAARSDGSVGRIAVSAMPLSHLPEMPGGAGPSGVGDGSAATNLAKTAPSVVPPTAQAVQAPAATTTLQTQAPPVAVANAAITTKSVINNGKQVVVLAAQQALALGETLPSKDLPVIARGEAAVRRGVPLLWVGVLVLAALFAGFLLGWTVARTG